MPVTASPILGLTPTFAGAMATGKLYQSAVPQPADEPTDGAILLEGKDILKYDDRKLVDFRHKKFNIEFQYFGLKPHRTVLQNAATGW